MIWIGVDPGKKGGMAVIADDAIAGIEVKPWDDDAFVSLVREMAAYKCVAAVEKVGAMPGQGVTSMFSFGQSYGFILGVLTAFGIGYQLVPPTAWKREFGLLHTSKQGSVEVAKRLFPGVNLMATGRSRKESDGMAEALLIAEWCRRKM